MARHHRREYWYSITTVIAVSAAHLFPYEGGNPAVIDGASHIATPTTVGMYSGIATLNEVSVYIARWVTKTRKHPVSPQSIRTQTPSTLPIHADNTVAVTREASESLPSQLASSLRPWRYHGIHRIAQAITQSDSVTRLMELLELRQISEALAISPSIGIAVVAHRSPSP